MKNSKRNLETEAFIDTLPKLQSKIYRFMRKKYDELKNEGENYDVEEHDQQIARIASEEFNITKEEAGDLYEKTEFQISKFHTKGM